MTSDEPRFPRAEAEQDQLEGLEGIDTTVPHSARIWNYWLGGKDNLPVDRAAGDQYMATFPGVVSFARLSRLFHIRAVRYLAGEAGVRQFLDVGAGFPTLDATHEVAQRAAPQSRIVYVDHDPMVLARARAMLTSTPEGAAVYIKADMREPGRILEQAAATLDFAQPVALLLMGCLGHIADDDEAQSIVRRLVDGLPSGSYLVITDGLNVVPDDLARAQRNYDEGGSIPYVIRNPDQVSRFFVGVELLEPGLVPTPQWRPEAGPAEPLPEIQPFGGVGRKP
jgi:hypothetical protein